MRFPACDMLALIDFHWAFNPWLVLLFIAVAGALVVYLYNAQQRVASRRVILSLTAIRVALMLLVLVLLAGPVYQWHRSADAGGTLFVLLDQSPSMAHVDRQATPLERLRWADALGLVPPDLRPAKTDRQVAALSALRQEWDALKARGDLAVEEREAASRVQRFGEGVGRWAGRLNRVADALERTAGAGDKVTATLRSLREAVDLAAKAADGAATRARPEDAAADVPWQAVAQRVDAALANLPALADRADAAFLAAHGNDAPVRAAMGEVAGMSRAQFLVASLTAKSNGGDAALADVLPRQNVRVVAFADAPQPLAVDDPGSLPELLKKSLAPAGRATNLAAALAWVRQQVGPEQPAASVLVVSDGRQNIGGDLIEPARLLGARDARVFALGVGSAEVVPDAAVERVDAPEWVYQGDVVRGDAMVRLDGLANKPVKVEVRRRGGPGGSSSDEKVIETQTVTAGQKQDAKRVGFRDQPAEPGLYEYEVSVADVDGEAVTENNRQSVRVSVRKDKLNVLLVEEQPRWEYRYLANYLERDGRVKLQAVLLEPAQVEQVVRPAPVRASPDNKQTLVDQLPNTKEGWAAFDLIVLGDVPPEALNGQSQQWIASAVQERGAALVLIAGPFNLPQRYARSRAGNIAETSLTVADSRSLIDLFPVYRDAAWSPDALAAHLRQGFAPRPAPEGLGSVLSEFSVDGRYNAQLWSAVPAWYWHGPFTRAKPGASVLWSVSETEDRPGAPSIASTAQDRALLTTMQFGAGRVLYLASDQTWRLRQVNGENLHERFWGQVIRWAAGNDLPAGGKFLRFGTDKPRYVGGEPVRVTARLLDREKLVPLSGQKELKVVARSAGKVVGEAPLVEAPDTPGLYRAELSGLPAGTIELAPGGAPVAALLANDPSVTLTSLAVDVQAQAKLEQRNLNTDRTALARVARAGGGVALDATYADVLAASIPELNYRTETVEQFGLFADPKDAGARKAHWLFLALFATLITAEWVIRKAGGLV